MHYKVGRLNHNFQIVHFLIGSRHTADAAYALLADLIEDRSNALKLLVATELREEAKRVRANEIIESTSRTKAEVLDAKATLAELDAMQETKQKNKEAAEQELAFLRECREKINPHRKWKHLSDAEAAQAVQEEEWYHTLWHRAQNYLLAGQGIPADDLAAIRNHPRGLTMMPDIRALTMAIRGNQGSQVDTLLNKAKGFDFSPVFPTALPAPQEE